MTVDDDTNPSRTSRLFQSIARHSTLFRIARWAAPLSPNITPHVSCRRSHQKFRDLRFGKSTRTSQIARIALPTSDTQHGAVRSVFPQCFEAAASRRATASCYTAADPYEDHSCFDHTFSSHAAPRIPAPRRQPIQTQRNLNPKACSCIGTAK